MNLENKIDLALQKLSSIEERMNSFDQKFSDFSLRLEELEAKCDNRNEEVNNLLSAKVDLTTFQQLKDKLTALENFKSNYEKAQITQESHDKMLNILIHGIKENSDSPWEKHQESWDKYHDFLKNGLHMEDPDAVEVVDIHRLPQHPVQRFGRNVVRPIIVNLLTMQDKTLIFNSANHPKAYNSKRISEDATSSQNIYQRNSKNNASASYRFSKTRNEDSKRHIGKLQTEIMSFL